MPENQVDSVVDESISQAVGRKTIVSIGGRDYVLDRYSFHDKEVVRSAVLSAKRRAVIQPIADMQGFMEQEEWQAQFDRARDKASKILTVGKEDAELLNSTDVIVIAVFSMLDRRYPGAVTIGDIKSAIHSGGVSEVAVTEIIDGALNLISGPKN